MIRILSLPAAALLLLPGFAAAQEKLPDGDTTHFTNLLGLYSVNRKLRKLFRKPRGIPEFASECVTVFQAVVFQFYDFVCCEHPRPDLGGNQPCQRYDRNST